MRLMEEEAVKVRELEAQKLALIERYMKMQDKADEMNERIYHLCCEIKTLNLSIELAVEEEKKKKAAAAKAAIQGPSNGNGHSK